MTAAMTDPDRTDRPTPRFDRGRWSLTRRLGATYLVVAVAALLSVGAVVWCLLQLDDSVNLRSDRLAPAQASAASLAARLVDQETGIRGFLLEGDRSYLEPYREGQTAEVDLVARLRDLLRGEPRLERMLTDVEAASAVWHDQYAEVAVATGTAADEALGRELFDDVRTSNDDLLVAVGERAERAREDVGDWVRNLVVVLAVVAVGLFGVFALIGWALRYWVIDPLGRLGRDARTVASGDLDHQVRGHGPSDLGALAADVEMMRMQLIGELTVARQAQVAVESQAEALRRSNRDLEQFAYVASHDLQEPLRKVASFCQLLDRRYGDKLDDRGTQYIEFAVDGAKRMQQLINDLLAFSRVGRTIEEFVPVPLADALGRAVAALAVGIEETRTEVTHDELPVVPGDAGLLAQLFQNLIGNAVKFRAAAPPRIHVSARDAGDVWELSCSDNGIGIGAEYAEKIFVIFQRLHPRQVYEGTGIGLALCRKIVEFHGGRIWLDDTVTSGATFRWTLPKELAAASESLAEKLVASLADSPELTEGTRTGGAS